MVIPPSLYFGVSLPVSIHAHLLVWYCCPFLRDAYIKVLEDEREGTITWSCSEERQNCFLLLMSWPLYLYFTGKCVFPLHKRPLTSIVNYDGGVYMSYLLFWIERKCISLANHIPVPCHIPVKTQNVSHPNCPSLQRLSSLSISVSFNTFNFLLIFFWFSQNFLFQLFSSFYPHMGFKCRKRSRERMKKQKGG